MIRKLIKSACVWYVYYPHVAMLRAIGPRAALIVTGALGFVHWLLTFVGAFGAPRRAMSQVLGRTSPDLSIPTVLRRHLIMKHQAFAEWYTYPTRRGRRFVQETYRRIDGREHLDEALAQGRGAIGLVFHFGVARILWMALRDHGYVALPHLSLPATWARETTAGVAKAAMRVEADSWKASGLKIIKHRPMFSLELMLRHLRGNGLLGVNGDGMTGTEFVDIPFMGQTMSFPTGPARLAANSGAPILCIFTLSEGLYRRRIVVHPPIHCADDSPDSLKNTMQTYVAILDQYVRSFPWSWWTWRRLNIEETAGGRLRITAEKALDNAMPSRTTQMECS